MSREGRIQKKRGLKNLLEKTKGDKLLPLLFFFVYKSTDEV